MAKKEDKYIVIKIEDFKDYQMAIRLHGLGNDGGRGDTYLSPEGRAEAQQVKKRDCEPCFEQSIFNGYFGKGGDCESTGHYMCLECVHLKRLPAELKGKVNECNGCLRPIPLCVCPVGFEILQLMGRKGERWVTLDSKGSIYIGW